MNYIILSVYIFSSQFEEMMRLLNFLDNDLDNETEIHTWRKHVNVFWYFVCANMRWMSNKINRHYTMYILMEIMLFVNDWGSLFKNYILFFEKSSSHQYEVIVWKIGKWFLFQVFHIIFIPTPYVGNLWNWIIVD